MLFAVGVSAPFTFEDFVLSSAAPIAVPDRLGALTLSLENAYDCGDDALSEQYEKAIAEVLELHPELR